MKDRATACGVLAIGLVFAAGGRWRGSRLLVLLLQLRQLQPRLADLDEENFAIR